MRRDAIFYTLFKRSPKLFFELVSDRPANAQHYRFESVEIKEPSFRIDGVFLPPDNAPVRTVFFAEVQFQKDELLYHRFFAESLLYLYRNPFLYDNWYGVIPFHSRSLEPENSRIHHALLESPQVQRIYLDELGTPEEQSIGIRLMQLTIAPDPQLIEQGKQLIDQAKQGQVENLSRQDIIEMVITIAVYKFTQIDRAEIEAMLGINLEETRIYQEAELNGKLQLVPLLVELGLTPEQIAARTGIALETIQQTIEQHSQTDQQE